MTTPTPQPIPFPTTRYRCPFCPRTAASRTRTRTHIARCWYNPATRGCKTCKHFDELCGPNGDECFAGVDLSGRPGCETCKGTGYAEGALWHAECAACGGHPEPIRSGPIVGCGKWEPQEATR